ncbi:MAG: DUF4432 family protein [Phaeodactylibacter sp.]|nr:DUF4432 family protein [Phaeodactylibacter sp.]MCB9276164.1 DUF4432 family protein [Lewinellaceae bacterium]
MQLPVFPVGRCSISDDWDYKDMKVIRMENDYLRIGILAGRGSDIFEFYYKPRSLDFMLRLQKGIINPQHHFPQLRDTPNQMEDYYYGGWQEALPNSPTFRYRGASLGQHGEVWMIPWKYAIIEDKPGLVAVKLWARPLRVPVLIEKTLSIVADEAALYIDEQLTNESGTHLDIMWGHHIAFGLPFLREGGRLITNARTMIAEPTVPAHRRFVPDIETNWPQAKNINGQWDDASYLPPEQESPYSDLAYLSGFDKKGYYTIRNEEKEVGFSVSWDASVFRYLWYWQERYATQDSPWWGNAYAIGLEPWTSRWRPDAGQAIADGEWLRLEAGEMREASLKAEVVVG